LLHNDGVDLTSGAGWLTILVVAVALGSSNLAASIGIGLLGVDAALRRRLALVFGGFEAAMPIVGAVLGRHAAQAIGGHADLVGGALVAAAGGYAVVVALTGPAAETPTRRGTAHLVLTGLALSLDNLVVGFALGTLRVNLLVLALVIAAVSVAMSLLGLELGARLGQRTGEYGELVGGIVLIGVGVAIAAGGL
jgi:manganese efflux pump family protein